MNDNTNKNLTKAKAELIASYLLSLSLFAVAASIAYFTYEVAIVSKHIPDVLVSIDTTTGNIEPVLDEVAEITDLVPAILKEIEGIREMIPPILKEVEQLRAQLPAVLKESEAIRGELPAVLKESEALRGELPAILASADSASEAVAGVSEQLPAILKEAETTRESIPPLMDRADTLIEKARVAGKEASQGAVTGIFSGIIMAPFALIADAGRGISGMSQEEAKEFNERDFELIEQAVLTLLDSGDIDDEESWNNSEADHHGTIVLAEIYAEGEYSEVECRQLSFKAYKSDTLLNESDRSFCQDEDGKWDFSEE